jgi:two-component system cell cycle sensor histidine kinase/response regulator CckA
MGKILLVDDDAKSLKLLSRTLADEEYDVRTADSGELALAAVTVNQPELILLDIKMPGMDGIEVCRRLKASAQTREIPVVLVSGALDFEDRLRGLQCGAVDFIDKPFRPEELLARVRIHLELARLRKDLERRVAERTAELQTAHDLLKIELDLRRGILEELRESERRFRSIADTVPAGIFMVSPEGRTTYTSKWLLKFLGASLEQVAGDGWRRFVHPEDLDSLLEETTSAIRERRSIQIEQRLLRSDGEYRWIAATIHPRFVNGEYAGHIGVDLDITDLKLAQERDFASRKLESVGMLAAGVAHNFNNLLSVILAHTHLLLNDIPDEMPAHESISTIEEVALRAAEIVNLLMTYADNSDPGQPEPVELSSLIRNMVPLLRGSISSAALLDTHLSEDLPLVKANARQIQQVVLNLILNASEALEGRPGTISISTAKTRVDAKSAKSGPYYLAEGDYVELEVVDTGCGMTAEVKSRIFDPFFSTKFLGRGLGMASVHGIVRSAGGEIGLESSPGRGSRFEVRLPAWHTGPE